MDEHGRWYHVNLELDGPDGRYRCAVDVDSKQSDVGVQWKAFELPGEMLRAVPGLAAGYHELVTEESAGAIDLIRHPAWAERFPRRGWTSGSNIDAAAALESTLSPGARMLVFGEPFTTGLGMHNIHQNQGDPADSQWFGENAIWQDGATLTEQPGGAFMAFVSKFSSQSSSTDDDGHPL